MFSGFPFFILEECILYIYTLFFLNIEAVDTVVDEGKPLEHQWKARWYVPWN